MSTQPNIFNYATSELTQDAFITWLLNWANPIYKDDNKPLHSLGTSFLESLLDCQDILLNDEITDFNVKQQLYNIDVFVSFKIRSTSYGIIIEDKIHSSDHGNQLERYIATIVELKAFDVLIPIYFKTGYQVNLSRIKEKGYHYYSIKHFLKLIPEEEITQINNDVLSQYYNYLLKKEIDFDNADAQANNYLTHSLKDWTWWTCARFFHEYKIHFNGHWGEVPNNRERLLAFWFGGREITIMDNDHKTITLNLYIDIVYVRYEIQVSYRISLLGNEQKNALIKNKIYEAFVPFLIENGIECRKAKFTNAKRSLLLAQISNLDRNIKYETFVEKIEHYQKALNKFVDSRI